MILDLLTSLADCLCSTVRAEGLPDMCFCGVVPGAAAASMYAGECDGPNGMGWVRMVTTYPADGVGAPNTQPGNCGAGLGLDIEVGIMRIAPWGDEQGNPPTDSELLETTALQTADMLAMRKAVLCCSIVDSMDMSLGSYTPVGPEGGMVGGIWTLQAVTY